MYRRVLLLVCTTLTGSLAVGHGALGATAAPAALGGALNRVWFDGEPDTYVYDGQILFSQPAVQGAGPGFVRLSISEDGHWFDIWFAAATGQNLVPGVYENARRFAEITSPQLDVFGDGRGCNGVTGRFIVDDITWAPDQTLLTFAARFEHHCEGGDGALFGAVSYNSTAESRTRRFSPQALNFGSLNANAVSGPQTETITNDGPSPLAISSLSIDGADAGQFTVGASACPAVLASGESCAVTLQFAPTGAPGSRAARLVVHDDLAPDGGSGRRIALSGSVPSPSPPTTTTLPGSPTSSIPDDPIPEDPPVEPSNLGSLGEFTPLTPTRILDTRDGTGGFNGAVGTGQILAVQITGTGGVPTLGVTSVVMNVTATEPTANGYLTVWPTGTPQPTISNLNTEPGVTRPNLVTVATGVGGRVNLFNSAGSSHVIFDVVGYYADVNGTPGSRFHPVDPFRLFDTRDGTGKVARMPLTTRGVVAVNVSKRSELPSSAITAIVMNVTVTEPTAAGYLVVYPGDVGVPTASNLNFVRGQTVPNLVTVRVPSSGVIDFFNSFGDTHVLADVVGYYDTEFFAEEGRFVAVYPTRLLDTRLTPPALGPDALGILTVAGRGGVPVEGAEAAVLNVTVTAPTSTGYLSLFSDDLCDIPDASNLNFQSGQTVPNLAIVALSFDFDCASRAGAIDIYNSAGSTHVVVDVFGYFTDYFVAP